MLLWIIHSKWHVKTTGLNSCCGMTWNFISYFSQNYNVFPQPMADRIYEVILHKAELRPAWHVNICSFLFE